MLRLSLELGGVHRPDQAGGLRCKALPVQSGTKSRLQLAVALQEFRAILRRSVDSRKPWHVERSELHLRGVTSLEAFAAPLADGERRQSVL
jgi:hypothetical protein